MLAPFNTSVLTPLFNTTPVPPTVPKSVPCVWVSERLKEKVALLLMALAGLMDPAMPPLPSWQGAGTDGRWAGVGAGSTKGQGTGPGFCQANGACEF